MMGFACWNFCIQVLIYLDLAWVTFTFLPSRLHILALDSNPYVGVGLTSSNSRFWSRIYYNFTENAFNSLSLSPGCAIFSNASSLNDEKPLVFSVRSRFLSILTRRSSHTSELLTLIMNSSRTWSSSDLSVSRTYPGLVFTSLIIIVVMRHFRPFTSIRDHDGCDYGRRSWFLHWRVRVFLL